MSTGSSAARYPLGEVLGQGVAGTTFAAVDAATQRDVVVKRLGLHGLAQWDAFDAFEREVRLLRTLDHPGVPKFLDAFQDSVNGCPYMFLVYERIFGQNLAETIAAGNRWTATQATDLLTGMLDVLDYLHTLSPRVIHCDIQPRNIIARAQGRPVLVDFGSVYGFMPDPRGAVANSYTAPEQLEGHADPRTDLYGLAATMVHVLTHRDPSDLVGPDLESKLRQLAGVDDRLTRILARSLHAEPSRRYPTARAAKADLYGLPPAPRLKRQ